MTFWIQNNVHAVVFREGNSVRAYKVLFWIGNTTHTVPLYRQETLSIQWYCG